MAYATPISIDPNGGLRGTQTSGTYKSMTMAHTLTWTAANAQSCYTVFSLMQADMQRAFDFEMPDIAEKIAVMWRDLASMMERAGSINSYMAQNLLLQCNAVLRRGYEQLGQKLPASSSSNTPETVQQPGVIYTPQPQPIPAEMLEPPPAPVPTGGVTVVPGTAAPGRSVTYDVVSTPITPLPSGPGGGIVHAQEREQGIPWKWLAIGLGIFTLLKRR